MVLIIQQGLGLRVEGSGFRVSGVFQGVWFKGCGSRGCIRILGLRD